MTKSIPLLLAAGLLSASLGAIAQGTMPGSAAGNTTGRQVADADQSPTAATAAMRAMDTNGDGMVSREEFAKYHDGMYNSMHPNAQGMVDIRPAAKMQSRLSMGGKPMAIDAILMGARSDGMVSRDQYMKYHNDMYSGMQMNKENMVDAKTMMMK